MSPGCCDLCKSSDYRDVYAPVNTRRDARIAVCGACGLVFSRYGDIPYSREPNPSGDADWGNIRWAKGFRLDALRDRLANHINSGDVRRVTRRGLRTGETSSSGSSGERPGVEITAVEPDDRVVSGYRDKPGVDLRVAKLENVALPPDRYDFAYCCQTLEHAASASAMLAQVWSGLREGGSLFLEVPNIDVLRHPLTVEEFFIDKHSFHFNHRLLCSYLEWLGFRLEDTNPADDFLNVRVLATKSAASRNGSFLDRFQAATCRSIIESLSRDTPRICNAIADGCRRSRHKSTTYGSHESGPLGSHDHLRPVGQVRRPRTAAGCLLGGRVRPQVSARASRRARTEPRGAARVPTRRVRRVGAILGRRDRKASTQAGSAQRCEVLRSAGGSRLPRPGLNVLKAP